MPPLVTAGVSFILRASVGDTLRTTFFDPINPAHSAEMIGAVLGVGSLGFALTIAIGSPLLDSLGMGRLLPLSSLCFICGTLIVTFADRIGSGKWIRCKLAGQVGGDAASRGHVSDPEHRHEVSSHSEVIRPMFLVWFISSVDIAQTPTVGIPAFAGRAAVGLLPAGIKLHVADHAGVIE